MNSRIQELKEQATEEKLAAPFAGGITVYELNPERFAELIITECMQVLDPGGDPSSMSMTEEVWREKCAKLLSKHFGVNYVRL